MIRGAAAAAGAGLGLGSGRAARRDPVSLRSKDMEYAATRTGDEQESFRGRLREHGGMGRRAGSRASLRAQPAGAGSLRQTPAQARVPSIWTTAQHVNTLHTCACAREETHARTQTHARTHARMHARTSTRTHARIPPRAPLASEKRRLSGIAPRVRSAPSALEMLCCREARAQPPKIHLGKTEETPNDPPMLPTAR